MSLAPFFERVYGAIGGHLSISRESLQQALANTQVGLRVDTRGQPNERWCSEMATNLLSRLYPRICLTGNPSDVERLADLSRRINPNIELCDRSPSSTTIHVGVRTDATSITASASGWVAHCGGDPINGPANPYAAGAAGALAAAELFRRVFTGASNSDAFSLSLLRFDTESGRDDVLEHEDVGDAWFAGAGAVGNAAVWALSRHAGLRGQLTVIDPETLSLANLQRYVLGDFDDVDARKPELVSRAFASSAVKVSLASTTLEDYANHHAVPNTIVVSVDNVAGRRAAQALLPRLVINGWTGESGLGASWHIFSHDAACLACLYHPRKAGSSVIEQAARALGFAIERATLLWVTRQPLTAEDIRIAAGSLGVSEGELAPWRGRSLGDLYTDAVCGAVPLDVKGVGRVETVPLAHQSALAGVLMAAELVKRTSARLSRLSNQDVLVSYDDIRQPPPKYWLKPRSRERGCICTDADYQAAYLKRWPSGGA